jgi:hypothetical protein
MTDEKDRLMAWEPGMPGFSHDEMILAVGLQCRTKRFPLRDVLSWLGAPAKATGNAEGGHLVYFYSGNAHAVPLFDVSDGRVVGFGTVARSKPNTVRPDGEPHFNILDELETFDETVFT